MCILWTSFLVKILIVILKRNKAAFFCKTDFFDVFASSQLPHCQTLLLCPLSFSLQLQFVHLAPTSGFLELQLFEFWVLLHLFHPYTLFIMKIRQLVTEKNLEGILEKCSPEHTKLFRMLFHDHRTRKGPSYELQAALYVKIGEAQFDPSLLRENATLK